MSNNHIFGCQVLTVHQGHAQKEPASDFVLFEFCFFCLGIITYVQYCILQNKWQIPHLRTFVAFQMHFRCTDILLTDVEPHEESVKIDLEF